MPVLVYKNGYERQKGKDKDPENIMDRIKESKVILLLVVLFISVLFIAMIRYFLLAIFLAAISSALAMPIFHRFSSWFKGKKSLNAALTLLTLMFMVFIPFVLLIGIVMQQAAQISRSAVPWMQQQILEPAVFQQHLRSLPFYNELELYRGEILQKAGEISGQEGSILFKYVSSFTLSAVQDLVLLLIFFYVMFFFIRDGNQILEKILSCLPLSQIYEETFREQLLEIKGAKE